jgi:hypothetical protein
MVINADDALKDTGFRKEQHGLITRGVRSTPTLLSAFATISLCNDGYQPVHRWTQLSPTFAISLSNDGPNRLLPLLSAYAVMGISLCNDGYQPVQRSA